MILKRAFILSMILQLGLSLQVFSQNSAPPVHWQKSYWPYDDDCPDLEVLLEQNETGEDWFYR